LNEIERPTFVEDERSVEISDPNPNKAIVGFWKSK
jgi:hypothetical protein